MDVMYLGFSFLLVPFCLLYVYTVFSLYIGHEKYKYRAIVILLNIVLLLIYIFMLMSVNFLGSAALIILFLILLAIIVLGLIGGFMYNPELTKDRSDEFKSTIKGFGRLFKATAILIGVAVISIIGYRLLTHSVDVLNRITYVTSIQSGPNQCDSSIEFSVDSKAELILYCGNKEAFIDIDSIEIYVDDLLIHSKDFEEVYTDPEMYFFDYEINAATDLISDNSVITIVLTNGDVTETYTFTVYDTNYGYATKVLPIWKN